VRPDGRDFALMVAASLVVNLTRAMGGIAGMS
jgi:hypothetical protein